MRLMESESDNGHETRRSREDNEVYGERRRGEERENRCMYARNDTRTGVVVVDSHWVAVTTSVTERERNVGGDDGNDDGDDEARTL